MKRIIVILSSLAVFTALAAFVPPAHARSSMRHARIQACADKSAGDPCSYTKKGENVDGTCGTARHGKKLICTASNAGASEPSGGAMAPSGGRRHGRRHGRRDGALNWIAGRLRGHCPLWHWRTSRAKRALTARRKRWMLMV